MLAALPALIIMWCWEARADEGTCVDSSSSRAAEQHQAFPATESAVTPAPSLYLVFALGMAAGSLLLLTAQQASAFLVARQRRNHVHAIKQKSAERSLAAKHAADAARKAQQGAATRLQRAARCFLAKRRAERLRRSSLRLQLFGRLCLRIKRSVLCDTSARVIQSACVAFLEKRRAVAEAHRAATLIQCHAKRFLAVQTWRELKTALSKIQLFVRERLARRQTAKEHNSARVIQSACVVFLEKRRAVAEAHRAATLIQCHAKRFLAVRTWREVQAALPKIQLFVRERLAHRQTAKEHNSARVIQSACVAFLEKRRAVAEAHRAATLIQCHAKRFLAARALNHSAAQKAKKAAAALVLQHAWKRRCEKRCRAARFIQCAVQATRRQRVARAEEASRRATQAEAASALGVVQRLFNKESGWLADMGNSPRAAVVGTVGITPGSDAMLYAPTCVHCADEAVSDVDAASSPVSLKDDSSQAGRLSVWSQAVDNMDLEDILAKLDTGSFRTPSVSPETDASEAAAEAAQEPNAAESLNGTGVASPVFDLKAALLSGRVSRVVRALDSDKDHVKYSPRLSARLSTMLAAYKARPSVRLTVSESRDGSAEPSHMPSLSLTARPPPRFSAFDKCDGVPNSARSERVSFAESYCTTVPQPREGSGSASSDADTRSGSACNAELRVELDEASLPASPVASCGASPPTSPPRVSGRPAVQFRRAFPDVGATRPVQHASPRQM